MKALAVAAALVFALIGSACARVETEEAGGVDLSGSTIRVVATVGMIADAVERVGGDRVEVEALMGPGIDPHVYKASEGDVQLLVDADLVFFNGLHLEAKLADVLERLEGRAVAVAEAIPPGRRLEPPGFGGNYDPHVWFDVRLWGLVVERVRDVLAERDPANAAGYRERAGRYLTEMRELDEWIRGQVERVPRVQRVLVTAHDAFNYFGRAYGFDVRGLQGISTASEAGAGDIQTLAAFIAERQIRAMFVESSVSPRAVEAVQEAVRARGFDVRIGEPLFSDAMGDRGTPEGTYLGMVRFNTDTIVGALSAADTATPAA